MQMCMYIHRDPGFYIDRPGYSDIPISISTSNTRYCFLNIMIYLKGTRVPCGSGCF